MSDRRLSVKFYSTDASYRAGEPYWRWFDAVAVPRVGEYVVPRATLGYVVTSVTWVEVNEVNVMIEPYSGEVLP
jgi:hypothetical protein